MDFLHPQVVLEPIIVSNLVIEEDPANPTNEFFETFRRNQVQSPNEPHQGALVLIRANGIHRRNFLLPAIIPRLISNRVIALPEFPPVTESQSIASRFFHRNSLEIEKVEMGPIQGIWGCACPVPGSQALISCGECRRRECFEWNWDRGHSDSTTVFQNSDREVLFNPGFSVGTGAVRGSAPLKLGYHHYWEVEMSTEVYGTDMMIGVGTDKTDLQKYAHNFVSLIGLDEQSWGISYTGAKHHGGKVQQYTNTFGQHTVVGVHLDMWSGKLEFYINRKPVGLAFNGLQGKVLYPMISSTAARSGMNLIFSRSYPPTLQLQTMLSLGKHMLLPDNISLFKVLPDNVVPPGLKLWMKNNFWWITSNREAVKVSRKPGASKEKKTDKKGQSRLPTITVTETVGPSSQPVRRGRKTKKDDTAELEAEVAEYQSEGIVTRSMASRRTFVPGMNPIFAPPPEVQTTSKLLKVSDGRRPITRSTSSPSVPGSLSVDEEEDTPYRPGSSNSNEPGSKRMCLRSSKR